MKKCIAIWSIIAGLMAIAAGIVLLCVRKGRPTFYYSAHLPIMDDDLPIMDN